MEKRPGMCQGAWLKFYVIFEVGKLLLEIYLFCYFYEIIIGWTNIFYSLHIFIIADSRMHNSIWLINIDIIYSAKTFCINENTPTYNITCSKIKFLTTRNIVLIFTVFEDIFWRFLTSYYSPDASALFR